MITEFKTLEMKRQLPMTENLQTLKYFLVLFLILLLGILTKHI